MSWLDHLSVSRKILLAGGISLVLLVAVGLLGLRSASSVDERADTEVALAETSQNLLHREVDHLDWLERAGLFRGDPSLREVDASIDHRECALGQWYRGEGRAETEARVPGVAPVLARLDAPHRELHASAARLDALLAEGDREGALEVFAETSVPAAGQVREILDEARGILREAVEASGEARNAAMVQSRWITFAGLGGAVLLALIASTWVGRSVARRLAVVAERAEELKERDITNLGKGADGLARGDLDYEVDYGTPFLESEARDEIGELARTVDGMIRRSVATIESFNTGRTVLKQAMSETADLVTEAGRGRLSERGDADRFQGAYAELVGDVNSLLDAVVDPVEEATEVLQRLADRDLTARLHGDYKGDHAKIKDALNTAAATLEEALTEVAAAADQVENAADQISTGSQELAQGSSEQASSLEEISSSIQEMAAMAQQSAGNAREAETAARKAREDTSAGEEAMTRLTEAMERIEASADATAKVVKTIDEIAFQTNLLALNAAVEAARAGEAGKGFAVVAEEVRALAMSSGEAARNTAELIEEAVGNTRSGVELNAEVLERLAEIGRGNTKVLEVVAEVAAASRQQSDGVEQINSAVEQMNSTTQQVAANAEESASAAEELTSQASEVKGLVGRFSLSTRAGGGQPGMRFGAVPRPVSRAAGNGHGNGKGSSGSPGNGNGSGNGRGPASNGGRGSEESDPLSTAASRLIPFDDEDTLADF